jgi:hypothetical protein
VENVLAKYLGIDKQSAAFISLPAFPLGVDAVRFQRVVSAIVRRRPVGKCGRARPAGGAGGYQPGFAGEYDGLDTVPQAELGQYLADMVFTVTSDRNKLP